MRNIIFLFDSSIQLKIKQYLLMNNINTECYKCRGNDKRLFTIKCSIPDCQKYYHPICIKEGIQYSNATLVDDTLLAVSFCEEHSQKFLIEDLNFNKVEVD